MWMGYNDVTVNLSQLPMIRKITLLQVKCNLHTMYESVTADFFKVTGQTDKIFHNFVCGWYKQEMSV